MENRTSSIGFSSSQPTALMLTFCLISAVFMFLVHSGNFIFGSDAGNWSYPTFDTAVTYLHWIPFALVFLLGILVFAGFQWINRLETLGLVGSFLIALVFQVLLNSIYPVSLDKIITSDMANSFYSIALQYTPSELLSQYMTLSPTFPYHAASNMPGKILFFQMLTIFTSSPRIMAYLIIAISTLGAPLLYLICKKIFNDRTIAYDAFILYALIPCKIFFFPILNTVTPVLILACLYLFILYLDKKQALFLVLLGIALYLLVFFEPSPLVTGIIFLAVLVYAFGQKRLAVKDLFPIVLIPVVSFLAFHLVMRLVFSFDLFGTFRYVLLDAVDYNVRQDHDYWLWIGENTKSFFFDAGLPVIMIFAFYVIQIFSQLKTMKLNIFRWPVERLFTISVLLTYLIVLFLGINRGETTRLWIYLAVFFQVPAAIYFAKIIKSRPIFFIFALTLAAQSFVTLQTVKFITP